MDNISRIYEAIEECDVTQVQHLLISNPELINCRNKEDNTPLCVAVYKDTIGPQTDYHRESGERFVKIVELLISYGSDINAKDVNGRSALHNAVIQGHADIVKLLLSKGANPNAQDNYGDTPMHVIYEEPLVIDGHKHIMELLFCYGADVSIKNPRGHVPFDFIKANEDPEIIERFIFLSKNSSANS